MLQAGTAHRSKGNVAFLFLVLAAGLAAFYFFHAERRNAMQTIETATGLPAGIPPIDEAAPKKTETATFSLG
jgi:hypothetical protein